MSRVTKAKVRQSQLQREIAKRGHPHCCARLAGALGMEWTWQFLGYIPVYQSPQGWKYNVETPEVKAPGYYKLTYEIVAENGRERQIRHYQPLTVCPFCQSKLSLLELRMACVH